MGKQLNLYKEFFPEVEKKKEEAEAELNKVEREEEISNEFNNEKLKELRDKILNSDEKLSEEDFLPFMGQLKSYNQRRLKIEEMMRETESSEEKQAFYGMLTFPEKKENEIYRDIGAIFFKYNKFRGEKLRELEDRMVLEAAIKRKKTLYPTKSDIEKYESENKDYDPYRDIYPLAPKKNKNK